MKKGVLFSIQPKYVCDILNGKKTLELRKRKPNIPLPFKGYIYCTKKGRPVVYGSPCPGYIDDSYVQTYNIGKKDADKIFGNLQGKIIAEFTVNSIDEYECEMWDNKTFESIGEIYYSDDGYNEREKNIIATDGENCDLLTKSCVSWDELRDYLGQGFSILHAIHIDNLKICDNIENKALELKDFGLKKAPQSWCYVEEL